MHLSLDRLRNGIVARTNSSKEMCTPSVPQTNLISNNEMRRNGLETRGCMARSMTHTDMTPYTFIKLFYDADQFHREHPLVGITCAEYIDILITLWQQQCVLSPECIQKLPYLFAKREMLTIHARSVVVFLLNAVMRMEKSGQISRAPLPISKPTWARLESCFWNKQKSPLQIMVMHTSYMPSLSSLEEFCIRLCSDWEGMQKLCVLYSQMNVYQKRTLSTWKLIHPSLLPETRDSTQEARGVVDNHHHSAEHTHFKEIREDTPSMTSIPSSHSNASSEPSLQPLPIPDSFAYLMHAADAPNAVDTAPRIAPVLVKRRGPSPSPSHTANEISVSQPPSSSTILREQYSTRNIASNDIPPRAYMYALNDQELTQCLENMPPKALLLLLEQLRKPYPGKLRCAERVPTALRLLRQQQHKHRS